MPYDVIPFPDDLPPRSLRFAREVIKRLEALTYAQESIGVNISSVAQAATNSSVVSAIPDANTSISGKVRLATDAEADAGLDSTIALTPATLLSRLAGSAKPGVVALSGVLALTTDNTTAMTPLNTRAAIAQQATTGDGYGYWVDNWNYNASANSPFSTGFYWSNYNATNAPAGAASTSFYVGEVLNAGYSGATNPITPGMPLRNRSVQFAHEVSATGVILKSWQRGIGWTSGTPTHGSWVQMGVVPTASTGTAGIVQLATNAEVQTGTNTAKATTPQGVRALSPIGSMYTWGGTTAPTGFLLCQGQAVSRTTYAALFTAIGTTWGAGNGTTTFNLPKAWEVSNQAAPTPAAGTSITGTFTQFDAVWSGMTFSNFDAAWTTGNQTMWYIIATGV